MFLTTSNRSERPTEKLLEPIEPGPLLSCYCRHKKSKTTTTKTSRIRSVALIFFLVACLYWLYKVYTNATGAAGLDRNLGLADGVESRTKLKLISVFNRHGDRSPSDSLPPGDEFNQRPQFFWPNGLTNLTDSGKFRQFRVGLELRKRYEELLDYNASHYLAFSSPIYRCQESLEQTLHGLFDIDWPIGRGLKLISQYNADVSGNKACLATIRNGAGGSGLGSSCSQKQHLILPSGAGSPLEYKQIQIDTKTLPMLTYSFLNNCKYRLEHPTPVDKNLSTSRAIAELRGTKRLEEVITTNYATPWNFDALGLLSTIASELRLARTRETITYGQRNFAWATQLVPEYQPAGITLFDLYEQVVVLGYRDRIVDTADYIQLGPMLSSLVKSQQVALGQLTTHDGGSNRQASSGFDSANLYAGKKAVFYSTHDSILQLLLHRLGFIRADEASFETRFSRWHEADDVDQLLAGFRMSKFGMSLVFELYEMDMVQQGGASNDDQMEDAKKFPFVRASLYNQEDGKHMPIEYKPLKLGQLCTRLFQEQNPTKTQAEMERLFYNQEEFPIDPSLSCPFELFKNVTSHYMISTKELDELCGGSG